MDTEFCLGCDKQSSQGAYCSQACRLLDVEKGRIISATTTPTHLHNSSFVSTTTTSPIWPAKLNTNRFSLPPTFDFTPYQNKPTSPATPFTSTSESGSGYSSKRSSMASLHLGAPSQITGYIDLWKVDHPLSPEAQDQLHRYDSYFALSKTPTYYKRFTIS